MQSARAELDQGNVTKLVRMRKREAVLRRDASSACMARCVYSSVWYTALVLDGMVTSQPDETQP
jgi:hypothetical protein